MEATMPTQYPPGNEPLKNDPDALKKIVIGKKAI
jgi:hypothetical protein